MTSVGKRRTARAPIRPQKATRPDLRGHGDARACLGTFPAFCDITKYRGFGGILIPHSPGEMLEGGLSHCVRVDV